MGFDIKYQDEEDLKVSLYGDLDINTVDEFRQNVLREYEKTDKNLVFDLKNLDYIDSTGLGAIISVYKIVKEKNKEIYIKNSKKSIEKLFYITELDKLFHIGE
ncbi:MAG: STAS domain-containing protein [Tissierellia bacterium]|nr:STAS domain-containing protein [Tissierellia bacterium]